MAKCAIRAIILDAGGVILLPDLDWLAARAGELGIEVSRVGLFHAYYRMIHGVDLDLSMDRRGLALSTDEIRRYMAETMLVYAGAPPALVEEAGPEIAALAARDFPRESDIYHWRMPEVRDQLARLSEAGFILAVASNNDGALESQLTNVGVADFFAARLDSAIEGVSKPDPELLLRAARAIDVAPHQALYVGDIDRVDGTAARAAKMHFALMDPLAQPRPTTPRTIGSLVEILRDFEPVR